MYTQEQTQTMLKNADELVTADGSYRIDYYCIETDAVHVTGVKTGDEHIIDTAEIDLNDPEVSLYQFTLMNV